MRPIKHLNAKTPTCLSGLPAVTVFLLLLLSTLPVQADPAPESTKTPVDIKFWLGDMTPQLLEYNLKIVRATLNRKASDYPPYELSFNSKKMSPERWKLEAEEGVSMHTHFSGEWQGLKKDLVDVRLITRPYLKERLGLRKCITTKQQLSKFSQLSNFQQLAKLRVGQVRGWPDTQPYRTQNIHVVEAETYDALYSMLSRGRFECLPLSVLEIERALQEKQDAHPDLVIVPKLYFYYPLPVYLGVSLRIPGLADRFENGLDEMFSDGTMDRLFSQHFRSQHIRIETTGSDVFILDNPLIDTELNATLINRFISEITTHPRIRSHYH